MSDGIFGGNGANGTVSVRGKDGAPLSELLGRDNEAVIAAGNKARPGRLSMYDGNGGNPVNLTTADARLALGGSNIPGTVSVLGRDGAPLIELLARDNEAVIGLGQKNRPGRISLFNANSEEAVRIDTQNGGDIWIANGDIAEEFETSAASLHTGMVAVLLPDGTLAPCEQEYDSRVVGVVAGAGDYKPAIVLDRRRMECTRVAISLLGKVSCWVDASTHAIRAGDLLTSSSRTGHARVASNRDLSVGSIIGKALAPLASGVGLIPVLVTRH